MNDPYKFSQGPNKEKLDKAKRKNQQLNDQID